MKSPLPFAVAVAVAAFVIAGEAQAADKGASSAAAAKSGSVPGVVVEARPKPAAIPPKKKAALDAQAAKRRTWRSYRATATAPIPSRTIGVSAEARAENYPGLHTLPH